VSRVVKSTVKEAGEIKRLSVSVMVDGTYTTNAEGEKTYSPRSDEELSKIESLVRSAIGFDDDRGDSITIETMQFASLEIEDLDADNKVLGFEKGELMNMIEILTISIMGILVILLVLRPLVGKLLETNQTSHRQADELEEQAALLTGSSNPALPAPDNGFLPEDADNEDGMIDMNKVDGQVKASSVKKVEDIVDSYPAETVSVLRSWMTQE